MIQNNQLYNTSDVEIYDNRAENNKKAGMCFDDVYQINVYQNIISDSESCFHINKGRSTIISNNQCLTNKLVTSIDTQIIYDEIGTEYVYLINNTFIQQICKNCASSS